MFEIASRELLMDLTGFKRPSKIREMLDVMRIPYLTGRDGWPRVAVSEIERLLAPKTSPSEYAVRVDLLK